MMHMSKNMTAKGAEEYHFVENRELGKGGKDDYYLAAPGQWQGKLAEALGLSGEVTREDFRALGEGKDPRTGNQLRPEPKTGDPSAGVDLVLSAAKSVSVMATIDDRIAGALDRAANNVMAHIEEHYAAARATNADGERVLQQTGNLAVAKFSHTTSREGDPQLHIHCFMMNMTQRADGEYRAMRYEGMYPEQKEIGVLSRLEIAAEIKKLGYKINVTDAKQGFYEIVGVSEKAIEAGSKRKKQIDNLVEIWEKSGKYQDLQEAEIRQRAAYETRKWKDISADPEIQKSEWKKELGDEEMAGLEKVKSEALARLQEREQTLSPEGQGLAVEQAPEPLGVSLVRLGGDISTEQESVVTRGKILADAAKMAMAESKEVRLADLNKGMGELQSKGEVLKVAAEKRKDGREGAENSMTTREVALAEAEMVDRVRGGRGKWTEAHSRGKVEDFLATHETGKILSPDQRTAVISMLCTRDRTALVQGDAGTGKTTALKVVKDYLAAEGLLIRGASFTGKAASEIQQAGIESSTIDAMLHSKNGGEGLHMLIIDEAAMTGSKHLVEVQKYADEVGAKVCYVGDIKQFNSIAYGKVFEELQKDPEQEVSYLTSVRRQKEGTAVYEAQAKIKAGKVAEGLGALEAAGYIKEEKDDLNDLAVKKYLDVAAQGKEVVVMAGTNKDRGEINTAIRAELLEAGKVQAGGVKTEVLTVVSMSSFGRRVASSYVGALSKAERVEKERVEAEEGKDAAAEIKPAAYVIFQKGKEIGTVEEINQDKNEVYLKNKDGKDITLDIGKEGKNIAAYKLESRDFGVGDLVVFGRNQSAGKAGITGQRVENGLRGEIVALDVAASAATVKTEKGEITVNLREYKHLDHAYCLTPEKSQGATVDVAIMAHRAADKEGGMSVGRKLNRNSLYVQATRAREECFIFTNNIVALKEQGKETQEKTTTIGRMDPEELRKACELEAQEQKVEPIVVGVDLRAGRPVVEGEQKQEKTTAKPTEKQPASVAAQELYGQARTAAVQQHRESMDRCTNGAEIAAAAGLVNRDFAREAIAQKGNILFLAGGKLGTGWTREVKRGPVSRSKTRLESIFSREKVIENKQRAGAFAWGSRTVTDAEGLKTKTKFRTTQVGAGISKSKSTEKAADGRTKITKSSRYGWHYKYSQVIKDKDGNIIGKSTGSGRDFGIYKTHRHVNMDAAGNTISTTITKEFLFWKTTQTLYAQRGRGKGQGMVIKKDSLFVRAGMAAARVFAIEPGKIREVAKEARRQEIAVPGAALKRVREREETPYWPKEILAAIPKQQELSAAEKGNSMLKAVWPREIKKAPEHMQAANKAAQLNKEKGAFHKTVAKATGRGKKTDKDRIIETAEMGIKEDHTQKMALGQALQKTEEKLKEKEPDETRRRRIIRKVAPVLAKNLQMQQKQREIEKAQTQEQAKDRRQILIEVAKAAGMDKTWAKYQEQEKEKWQIKNWQSGPQEKQTEKDREAFQKTYAKMAKKLQERKAEKQPEKTAGQKVEKQPEKAPEQGRGR